LCVVFLFATTTAIYHAKAVIVQLFQSKIANKELNQSLLKSEHSYSVNGYL
jgi:hypothetical protein